MNMQLPEKKTDNIRSILEANNLPAKLPKEQGYGLNCWGFTAFYYGWESREFWMDERTMELHLQDSTVPIKPSEVRAGDIAVFRRFDGLSHTAVMINPEIVCHKPGSTPLCIDTVENAAQKYGDVTYARVTSGACS